MKFGLVGASGVIVNLLIYTALITLDVNYLIAATVAFLFAVSSNFYLNFIWTFRGKGKGKSVKKKYLHFFIISLLNFVINLFILKIAVEFLSGNELTYDIIKKYAGSNTDKIIKIIAQITGIGVATFFNFFGNYFITFRE
ncbi:MULTISPECIES: GtrA family protein [Psychrilyobacter]|uniref:GtrA family protein n=2 Tax=Psychrilyobacter piezotolerans TaxID=2293438 RepID=A0ABX9KKH3_9FUSO|nr:MULTISPECIES: GtrA family protein [Psychrilyobacter]NDI76618.1 GtrA family protein [Psychrilyobacter piezotolerans]RDE65384.1 GtrA family protein [Psychrilyobacter sp. S5]REI43002.1 GtrA family protein [Psychrilyobacter piezotolerans]